ncbi:unnamed protein product [Triticum turgidum subsp. durum]|uniref:Protein CROWDED NUCLEI 1 n=1 Tax=Triticum turgidum subsp. durum TaxID=4567 RepID=A0A9R0YQU3_TRITD|nr:unnamed protein product [Triticum turgidum subsp. durum]
MFTPQGKGWNGWSTPSPGNQRAGGGAPPASAPLGKAKGTSQRAAELEQELHEYQYNMGLLLIEKKEWAAKFDEVTHVLTQKEEILKREQAAHLNAISEYEIRSEIAEVKFTSQKKIADAQSLEANLEEKSLEIEGKLHAADAKLAEANRKKSQADRDLEEAEARQRRLEKEKLYFETERKAREKQLKEQEESLQDWEKKLKESQNRLVDLQRSVNDREERANENDKLCKIKQEELEEAKKTVESTKIILKKKEEDIAKRLNELRSQEKDADSKHKILEKREKKLSEREEKASAREKMGLQKLIEDHEVKLEAKRRDFGLELESERKSFDEKMKHREADLVKKEKDLSSRENKISKREQALNESKKKLEELQNDLDTKSKALKKWDESLKLEKGKLSEEKLQLDHVRKQAEMYRSDIERLKATIEAEKKQILEEQNNLKVTEEERQEHSMLTAQLKKEIDEYRMRSNSLSEETEDLRKQRQKFEEEWEQLDEKRARLEEEAKVLKNEKTNLERWRHNEEKRFKDTQDEMDAKYKEQQDNLALKEKALADDIKHQREEIDEYLKRERADLQRNLQLHRHELEMEIANKVAIKQKELEQKEDELNKKRDFVENELKHAVDLNESKIQKITLEKQQLLREKEVLVEEKRKLETDKADIRRDIDSLHALSKSLKDRREAYNRDRNNLTDMFEKYKVCKSCGVSVFEGFGDLSLKDDADIDHPSLAVEGDDCSPNTDTLAQDTGTLVNSAGRFSLLQKCSRLFKFSPRTKAEQSSEQEAEINIPFGARLEEASPSEVDYEPTPVYQAANNSFDAEGLPSDSGARGNEESERLDIADDIQIESSVGVADNCIAVHVTQPFAGANDMAVDTTIASVDQNGKDSTAAPEVDLQPEASNPPKRKGRPRGVKKTKSVRAVLEDAKVILGENFDEKNDDQEDSVTVGGTRKRRLAGPDISDEEISEAQSESVSVGGQRRKRRQPAGPSTQAPGEKRYNLRRTTLANAPSAAPPPPEKKKGGRTGKKRTVETTADDTEGTSKAADSKRTGPSESADGASQLQEFSQAETVDAHATAGEEYGDIFVDGEQGEDAMPMTPSGSERGGVEDDDDDDSERRNKSIGKTLWSFFTT